MSQNPNITAVSGGFLPKDMFNKVDMINSLARSYLTGLGCRGSCILFKRIGHQFFSNNGFFPTRSEEILLKQNLPGIKVYVPELFVFAEVNETQRIITKKLLELTRL